MQAQPIYHRYTYSGLEPSQAFDVVYGTQFEHRLLSARRATMQHRRLSLPALRLETGSYDFPVVACGAMPRNVVSLGLVAEGAETTRYNTSEIGADEIQLYPQGVDLLYHASAASRWILLTVAEAALQQAAIACLGRPLDLPRHDACAVQLSRGRRSQLARLADDALDMGPALEAAGAASALASTISNCLVQGYVEALCEAEIAGLSRGRNAARQHLHLVLACERLAICNPELDISLDEIARRSGYSRRALELIFRRSVGTSPGRWFMNVRLNGALRELLSASQGCRVADVAARWGFRHLPRFAEQYRRAFGELPSQTLHRGVA